MGEGAKQNIGKSDFKTFIHLHNEQKQPEEDTYTIVYMQVLRGVILTPIFSDLASANTRKFTTKSTRK